MKIPEWRSFGAYIIALWKDYLFNICSSKFHVPIKLIKIDSK